MLGLFPAFSNAQITITSDEVNPLGVYAIQSRDSTLDASLDPGGTGQQSWDFSALENNTSDTLEFYEASETEYAALFPEAELAATLDSFAVIYLEKNDNYIGTYGTYGTFTLPPYTVTTALKYNPAQTIIRFPMTYGQAYTETNLATAQVPGSAVGFPFDSLRSVTITNRSVNVDAYGELTTPIGTFDVLRSTEISTSYDSINYLNNGLWLFLSKTTPKTITYHNWWTNQFDLSFPVVQYKLSPGADTSMIWLNEFVSATHDSKNYLDVKLSPNPTSQFLNVEMPDGFVGQLDVYNLLGHRMLTQTATNSSERMNVQTLPVGSYVVILKDKKGKVKGFERFEVLR